MVSFLCRYLYTLILLMLLSGCSQFGKTQHNNDDALKEDTKRFFIDHPEYLRQKDKEELLYKVFVQNARDQKNEKASIYEILDESHEQLQYLNTIQN